MSSLVTAASTWTNDDIGPKKRQSTMRKTIKLRPNESSVGDSDENNLESDIYKSSEPTSIDEHQNSMQQRNSRVTELLNKITTSENDNNKMADFKPISHPTLNVKKDIDDNTEFKKYVPPTSFLKATLDSKSENSYGANETQAKTYSNYMNSYEQPVKTSYQPYYAKMGISNNTDNKLMEKINYMIHLLEEQQHEKTNNITEEFILYTFLGVFIIFIVDSFSKSGKYVR